MNTLFGINVVQARLKAGRQGILEMVVRRGSHSARLQKIISQAERLSVPVRMVDADTLDAMTTTHHQGVGLSVETMPNMTEDELDRLTEAKCKV